MKKKLFIYVLFCFPPFVAMAQWSNNPNQNLMIADTTGSQILPIVVSNSLGETYISWFSEFGDNNYDVYLQKLDKNGVKFWDGAGLQISIHETDTWVTTYDMKLDNDENVILVNQDKRTGISNVFAYKISPTGEFLWGNDGIQLSNTPGFDPAPKVVVADNNDLVFMWTEESPDSTLNTLLFVSRVSANGTKIWETSLADTLYDFMLPQILATTNDDFIVSWMTKSNLADTAIGQINWMHVFAQKIDAYGQPVWGNNIQIDSGLIMPFESLYTTPYLENDENGGAYVLWQSYTPVHHGGIPTTYLNRLYDDGSLWKPNGYNVSQLVENNHTEAQMIYLQDVDKVMVCWKEYHYDGTDCWGVQGQLFDSDGNQLWTDTGKVFVPLLCAVDTAYNGIRFEESTNNNALLIYQKDYLHIVGADTSFKTEIYAMSIDIEGEMIWSPPVVALSLSSSNKYQSALSNLGDDQWVLAWNDNLLNPDQLFDYGIYAQNISIDGVIGPLSILEKPTKHTSDVIISPNPAVNYTNIEYSIEEPGIVEISLLNLNGHEITQHIYGRKAVGTYNMQLNTSNLGSGMYIIKLRRGNSSTYKKFIKN